MVVLSQRIEKKYKHEKQKLIRLWNDKTLRKVVYLFLLIKIIIFTIGVSSQFIPIELTHRQIRSDNIFLNPWAQYDAGAYLDIAKNGYNSEYNNGIGNYAWYPLYPLLIRIFSVIGYELAAFLISNIASFFAVVMLYLLIKEEMNKRIAYKTIFFILLFPTSYIFTTMYTESLFLLLSVLCFMSAKKGKYLKAGIAGFLASLTRLQGSLLFLPILYLYLYNKKFNLRKIDFKIIFTFLIPLGFLTFLAYHFILTGNAFIQLQTQEKFYRGFSMPWEPILNSTMMALNSSFIQDSFYHTFNVAITLFFIILTVLSFKYLRKDYSLYLIFSLLLPLTTSVLDSISRFVLVMFPAFMVMAKISYEKRKFKIFLDGLYIIFVVLMILFTIRHANEWFIITI